MAINRWDPFRDLERLHQRMNRLLEESFRGARGAPEEDWAVGQWTPAVDIYERDGDVVLTAELPGVSPEDLEVRIENNVLSIRGQRRQESEVKEEQYYRIERSHGSFSRSFSLSSAVDQDKVQAEFRDGLLRIVMPRSQAARAKQVSIRSTEGERVAVGPGTKKEKEQPELVGKA